MKYRLFKIAATCFIMSFSLIFSSCSKSVPAQYQVKNKETAKETDYYLNITSVDEIGLDVISDWQKSIPITDGFYNYIYADPDSCDLLITIPRKQNEVAALTNDHVTINVVDSVLKVYIDEVVTETSLESSDKNTILHFVAPPESAWPSTVEVYWNTEKMSCDGSDWKK